MVDLATLLYILTAYCVGCYSARRKLTAQRPHSARCGPNHVQKYFCTADRALENPRQRLCSTTTTHSQLLTTTHSHHQTLAFSHSRLSPMRHPRQFQDLSAFCLIPLRAPLVANICMATTNQEAFVQASNTTQRLGTCSIGTLSVAD